MPNHRRTVDAARFAMVPRNDVPRSAFDIRHQHKTTINAGDLVPVFVQEVIPGDSYRVNMTMFARTATAIVPLMDNLYIESFFFFVPNRIVWTNWERFMGEQASPTDTTEFMTPYVTVTTATTAVGTLSDYFGITLNNIAGRTVNVSALPYRAYALIWNDFFRDEDLQTPWTIPLGDGPDAITDYALFGRAKRHDYFTTARPWPQKPINAAANRFGNAEPLVPGGAMTLPQSGAPVTGLGVAFGATPDANAASLIWTGSRQETPATMWSSDLDAFKMKVNPSATGPDVRVLINDIRTAELVQIMMERNARGGSRYAEIIRSHFGVISPDARLQRPEFLGGGRAHVAVHPLAQTSASGITGSTTDLGEQAGIGTAVGSRHGFSQSFTEHGHIIGIINCRADLTYQNGIERFWFRRTQFDFFWPALQGLGEQAILMKELYTQGNATDDTVWGYQERWSEYKTKPSRVSGGFRSNASTGTPLDMWHLAVNYGAPPASLALNSTFIDDNPPLSRVLQVAQNYGEQLLVDTMFDIRRVAPMAMRSIPGMGPRF